METTPAALQLLRDHARLPGAGTLLEAQQLSALLGRDIDLDRVRIRRLGAGLPPRPRT